MSQSRIFARTNEQDAKQMAARLDEEFEHLGLPISVFETPDNPEVWEISLYCETRQSQDILVAIANIRSEIPFLSEELPETDWVAETLQALSAVRAGRFLIHGSHEKDAARPNEISIWIDAGLAFGTGHHGTTAGCLDMLTQVIKVHRFQNVLDLGTGSGVLAIGAAKAMPCQVMASDIDPISVETAKANVRQNGVISQIKCVTARGLNHPFISANTPFDLVMANILARPLQSMAWDIVRNTAKGGSIILSGLLPHQRAPLIARFCTHGCRLKASHVRDGWLTLLLQKP